jgi:hypothetical protein
MDLHCCDPMNQDFDQKCNVLVNRDTWSLVRDGAPRNWQPVRFLNNPLSQFKPATGLDHLGAGSSKEER